MSKQAAKPARKVVSAALPAQPLFAWWHYALALFVATFAAFQTYAPSMRGPFLFDDLYLPFAVPNFSPDVYQWVRGVRPLLLFSYWLTFRSSGQDPYGYHVINVLLHLANGLLIFAILRKLLEKAGESESRRALLAAAGAGIFLLHPVQTESVAYIASRSENLSGFFFFAAFALFLCRRSAAVGWLISIAVLVLYGMAVTTKEHTITLVGLLLLTDYFWNPGFNFEGIFKNWRLYGMAIAGGGAGAALALYRLTGADTAGFQVAGITWYQYFFTQFRAFFVYLRLYVLPYGLSIEYDFPFSKTPLDHGAFLYMIAFAGLCFLAFRYARREPLAVFGFAVFVLLLLPTSSVVPILDPIAERRMYLPLPGLILLTIAALRKWRTSAATLGIACTALLLVLAALAYQRNIAWGSPVDFWKSAVDQAPKKVRPHFQLAYAYFQEQRYDEAVKEYEVAGSLEKPDYRLLLDWAVALDAGKRSGEALAKLEAASQLEKTGHVFAMIGMIHGREGRPEQAMTALDMAEKQDPNFDMTYFYRGNLKAQKGDFTGAAADYQRAAALNPSNEIAKQALAAIQQSRPR